MRERRQPCAGFLAYTHSVTWLTDKECYRLATQADLPAFVEMLCDSEVGRWLWFTPMPPEAVEEDFSPLLAEQTRVASSGGRTRPLRSLRWRARTASFWVRVQPWRWMAAHWASRSASSCVVGRGAEEWGRVSGALRAPTPFIAVERTVWRPPAWRATRARDAFLRVSA